MAARKAEEKTKTRHILDFVQAHPTMRNVDVVAALAEQGVEVTANFVSVTKSKAGLARPRGAKKGRKARKAPVAENGAPSAAGFDVKQVRAAASFIKTAGSVKAAKAALAAAEEVLRALE